jgi:hypothetical protein
MCFNCGCEMPDDTMGDDRNITVKTFEEAAKAMGQTKEQAMEETYKLLKKVLNKPSDQASASDHSK